MALPTPLEYSKQLMSAPAHIRNFLDKHKFLDFLADFHIDYGTHLDALEGLDNLIRYHLVGLLDEASFRREVKLLVEDHSDEILAQINSVVLIPLLQELKTRTEATPKQAEKAVLITPETLAQMGIKTTAPPPPSNEILMRTMKQDVTSVKAGEPAQKFPVVAGALRVKESTELLPKTSKFLAPLGGSTPVFKNEKPKSTFSSFMQPVAPETPTLQTTPQSTSKPSSLPPQSFLPVHLESQPKSLHDDLSPVLTPVSTPSPVPTSSTPQDPVQPSVPPVQVKPKIDPYREIPE